MSTLTWLHLSDLHFHESQEYDIEIILTALERDLKKLEQKKNIRPDLIFFTGDVVYSGKKEQYDKVGSHVFDRLLKATGLNKDRLLIVPGNHDVDRSQVSPLAYHMIQAIESDTDIKRLFDDADERRVFMRRLDNYAGFVRDYTNLPFSDERPFFVRNLDIAGWRVGIIGLNSVWASGSVKDQAGKVKDHGELLMGRHLVVDALEEIVSDQPDVTIALVHHPFDWLKEFDQAQVPGLLRRDCHFILRGHLHRTETLRLEDPDTGAMIIAAGSVYKRRDYPNTYNVIQLDRDHKQGIVYLRRYGEKEIWGADTLTYENVPNGEYMFNLPDPLSSTRPRRSSKLETWLSQWGLRQNPFSKWTATQEDEKDLSGYFVDTHGLFDELMETNAPCVLLAARGQGKTAYRKTLASHCRPIDRNSQTLAITHVFFSLDRVLRSADGVFCQIEAGHHIDELLRQGLSAIQAEAEQDSRIKNALEQPYVASRLASYQARYAPHLVPDSAGEPIADLENLTPLELLLGFASLVQNAGFRQCVILIDEVDEFPETAASPTGQIALLSPLLGTLPLIECPGLAFKFFLPLEVESTLRAQEWFRPGRLRICRIEWDNQALQRLISQRLTYFSARGDRVYTELSQLCEDQLAESIDEELIHLAEGRPRWAIVLADMLLRTHSRQEDPPVQIPQETWNSVQTEWPTRRDDLLRDEKGLTAPQLETALAEAGRPVVPRVQASLGWPILRLDKERGRVWLGDQELTSEINPQDYRVLNCLYEHQDRVCIKSLLIEEAWPEVAEDGVTDQTITASIARLRRVLGQNSPEAGYIETIRGRGYRLHPDGFEASKRVNEL
jgi:DNA-binding winged helix-turn-helix (wHTH) protein/predicted phosphodiesterase